MYNTIRPFVVDEKKDVYLVASVYGKNNKKVDGYIFDDGKKNMIEDSLFTIIINEKESFYRKRNITDFIAISTDSAGFVYVASPKLQSILNDSSGVEVEYYSVQIKGSDIEIDDYKIVKIIDKIDCIDMEKSDVKLYDDGDLRKIKSIVLDEAKIPKGKELFLLGKRNTALIVIATSLKEIIQDKGMTGLFFQDPSRYQHNF